MSNSEIKVCQNCKQNFTIGPEDFEFYAKINVPAPTWCPECRMQRRMVSFNERSFYRRNCDLCKSNTLSLYSGDAVFPVYCQSCWWSDKWDPMDYGREYDFSRNFFEQYKEFLNSIPHMALEGMHTTLVNSEYCNIVSNLKNCYLLIQSDYNEDCAYSTYLEKSKKSLDILMGDLNELCYNCSNTLKCFKTLYSFNCNECMDVWFSRNLLNCSNCFGCVNLRNKQFHIFNQPYSKEEYFNKLKELDFRSYDGILELQKKFKEFSLNFPRKHAEGLNNNNVSGDYVFNSKNTHQCYEVGKCEDVKYSQFLFMFPTKDSYDMTMWGGNASRMYECSGAGDGEDNVRFSTNCWANATNLEYCGDILVQNNNLLACYGLRKQEYCIFNKQYSKEEYDILRGKIIKHMDEIPYVDRKGRIYKYGEFFPSELFPFAYNETIAQAYVPLDKNKAEELGFRWKGVEDKRAQITLNFDKIPQTISEVSDDIIKEIIECEHGSLSGGECGEQCTQAFRIIPLELKFYREMNLPLPRLCPNCRHHQRLKWHNPIKFYKRKCMCNQNTAETKTLKYINTATHSHGDEPCPNEFETTYAPDRPEIVYCEQCYQNEVL